MEIVFQVSDSEIEYIQGDMLSDIEGFDRSRYKSFLFIAVDMKNQKGKKGKGEGHSWSRTQLADTTRAVNKLFAMPVILLFRHGQTMTLAAIHRRAHKNRDDRDVLEKVTQIKDIRMAKPHRAHIEILCELSLDRMIEDKGVNNFDKLHEEWEKTLDIELLNKRFYREIFAWFERAVKDCKFPDDDGGEGAAERHVIRLITRLLFIWFLKEKGLVPDDLFEESFAKSKLKSYDPESSDYYRAVLQNLFFATLNTAIKKREFSKASNETHRDFSKFRYKKLLKKPNELIEIMKQVPFVNGGLFDCLDDFQSKNSGGRRIDAFTDNIKTQGKDLHVPAKLLLDKNHGLLAIFRHYKFTIEESTPIDQEVALDPELLGSVFENLLASYNPETRETARKGTGSYYTPRRVVDYMVSEALAEALCENVMPEDGDKDWWRDRLLYLLDWKDAEASADAGEFFEDSEKKSIVIAIANLRTLDPAVGSGAFPMGILQTLTLALRRLDPKNKLWEDVQKERAIEKAEQSFDTIDKAERDETLKTISATFEAYRQSDYGRKLYLIQNGVFGVDIQPIACQIAKLRFFISLIIEQQPDSRKSNLGIKPLPNLETHFVAADTLIEPKTETDTLLVEHLVVEKQHEISEVRERYFLADSRKRKLNYIKEENRLREELQKILEQVRVDWMKAEEKSIEISVSKVRDAEDRKKLRKIEIQKLEKRKREYEIAFADALKVAQWNPYDQNAHADWFNPEYMFGVEGGFDVVIGNPPYIQLQKNGGEAANKYKGMGFNTFIRTGDIYQLFYERGCQLLKPDVGVLAYITSNSWMKAEYGKPLRDYFSSQHQPLRLLEVGKNVFEQAIVDASVLLVRIGGSAASFPAVDMEKVTATTFPPPSNQWREVRPDSDAPWLILSKLGWSAFNKMKAIGVSLKDWDLQINYGIKTGFNDAFIIDDAVRDILITEDPRSDKIIKPILRGRDIQRWCAKWAGKWLIDTHNGYGEQSAIDVESYPAIKAHLDQHYPKLEQRQDKGRTPYNLRNCAYHDDFKKEKLFWMDLTDQGRFSYDAGGTFATNTAYFLVGDALKYLCAVLNSRIVNWLMNNLAVTSGMGTTRWFTTHVEEIPIPRISTADQRPFIKLADKILSTKDADPEADVSTEEAKIDKLVYTLYGLSDREVKAVEADID